MEDCQTSVKSVQSSNCQTLCLLAQDTFLFKEQQEKLVKSKVRLYEQLITIQEQASPFNKYKLQLNFDTIFSVLTKNSNQFQESTHSGIPYGIKFEKFFNEIQILNESQPQNVLKWRDLLSKKLNQRNFHQIFKPIKKIGQGNFASVYLVSKNQNKNLYAVKAFSKQLQYEDQRGKQCLENEINIMRSLNSEYLMKLQGVYETDNSIYFVVEYLRGGLLYDKIKKKHNFSTDQVFQIMQSLLKGIQTMHEKKIMHRDLKPENILFRSQDSYQCVIADFGLATFADLGQYLFTRCGTPGYVAPQISNLKDKKAQYDPICDIFSLGVIFHIILLGQSPFPGTSCDEVLHQNRECKINFDDKIYKKINAKWLDLLKRMLEKDPTKRISAAQALNHPFFEENQMAIMQQLPVDKYDECDSPLMITKNVHRKRNLRLRDDSCLKFKMRQNIPYNKDEEEYIQKISSPLKKKIGRQRREKNSKTSTPSHFRQ